MQEVKHCRNSEIFSQPTLPTSIQLQTAVATIIQAEMVLLNQSFPLAPTYNLRGWEGWHLLVNRRTNSPQLRNTHDLGA